MKKQMLPTGTFIALLLLATVGCASTRNHAGRNIPASSRIAFENDRVRVIEYHTGTEKDICGAGMHTHPPHAFIMTSNARLRIVTPDGKESFEDAKPGDTGWEPAVEHRVENLMGNNAGCYVIEIKDKDWKPSTGLGR